MISLAPGEHAVYQLAPDLLLVFKPRAHREPEHVHAYRQRLRVLRGALGVETAPGAIILDRTSLMFTVAAGQPHATEALEDTWLLAEIVPPTAA